MIVLNGRSIDQGDVSDIDSLIKIHHIGAAAIVVEKNGTILKKEQWADIPVEDGDHIEIIRFVGGG